MPLPWLELTFAAIVAYLLWSLGRHVFRVWQISRRRRED